MMILHFNCFFYVFICATKCGRHCDASEEGVQSDKVGGLSVLATRQNEMIAMTVINIAVKVENVK